MGSKILIDCPKCSKRMRIPISYFGVVRCPKCKFQFDKVSKSDSESIDDEISDNTTTCTHCGGKNKVESGLTDYYRCQHCDYDVLTLEQSEKVKQQQEKRSQHWMNLYHGEIRFLIQIILGCCLLFGILITYR